LVVPAAVLPVINNYERVQMFDHAGRFVNAACIFSQKVLRPDKWSRALDKERTGPKMNMFGL
jgi:hypothetical protein